MGLTKIAIERPVFILMLMLLCIFGGFNAYFSMRKEENPDVSFGVATVTTIYPGAGPEEMNTLVSRKVEEAVAGISNLLEVTSNSQEGVSVVVLNFNVGTNMDTALSDIRAKVDGIVGELPRDAEKPTVSKFDFSAGAVLTLAVNSDTLNSQQLRDLMDQKVKDRFGQIPGVAAVTVTGGDIREIQVQLKRDRLLTYGIGITEVQRALAVASLNAPAGRMVGTDRETSVRVLGEFKKVADIENMVLSIQSPDRQGRATSVRLGDIATVRDAVAERRSFSRLNGSDAITIGILKARDGNAIEITKQARALLPKLKDEYGVTFVQTFASATRIEESLFDLNLTLIIGILLVAAIVYLFLHNVRGMIIVAIAIPVCLLSTLMFYKLFGFTVNNLSMLALSLAVGVLVDDAIVVLENIYRHLKMGEGPVEAAINGRSEIGLAAIAITLADVVVFLPVGFMGGVVGQFFRPLGIGFAIAVMLSLFVSFTVTPMLASRWYRQGEDAEALGGKFARRFEQIFGRAEHSYRRSLEWSLNHRWFVFIMGWIALIGIIMFMFAGSAKKFSDIMPMIMGGIVASVALCLVAMGISYWSKRVQKFAIWGTLFVFFFGLGPLSIIGKMLPEGSGMKPMLTPPASLVVALLIMGLAALIANINRPLIRTRMVANAIGFGLILALFPIGGFAYGQWKQDQLFKFQFFPVADGGKVSATVQLPPGASLDATKKVVERIENIVMKHPDTRYVVSRVGQKGGGNSAADQGTNYAQVDITLNDKTALLDSVMFWVKHEGKLRTRRDTAVAADMLEAIGRVPGANVTVSASDASGFGAAIQMSFRSDDREKLLAAANKIKDRLAEGAVEGVINVDISSKGGKPEVQVVPDRPRLADAGLSVGEVSQALRALYEGNTDTRFRVLGQEYDIRLMMDLGDRNNPDLLGQVPIAFQQGNPIFVDSVTTRRDGTSVDKIERRDRQEEVKVTADLLPGKAAGTVQQQINDLIQKEKLMPDGVVLKPLGQADVQQRESQYLMSALFVGLLLVYMLLASLYDNLLSPFIIQLAQPQALVGALFALVLTDKSLNIVGFIGLIALVGLVGKNAILLVDYTNTLRSKGMNRHDAIAQAGPTRLRPITMTTLAVLLGMLPVALAIGRGSEFRETIGITIIGGIALSTFLTLLVIPCSYTIFDDLGQRLAKKQTEPETSVS